jgi:hypothetical protein
MIIYNQGQEYLHPFLLGGLPTLITLGYLDVRPEAR